ncbi:RNA polymerase sigma factor SigJ [Actinoplanes sp. NPDC051411]|uniref:RNA polymerase sigma factor SigJ n=1 Tax=Actinoplanes sp. NPDC051411 TaxID=3155522 RepID=UPI00342D89B4
MEERPQLLNLAYRMLGTLVEAEDAVQEAYARWYAMSPERQEVVASPGAWLTTTTSRICLDLLGSARVRRERYVGEWIPEPVPDRGDASDPAERITLDESISIAFLVMLESMTPPQRVAFILHDVYRYSFDEVADIVGRTPAACRQLASSARRRVREAPAPVAPARQAEVVRDFRQAWMAQDIESLIGLLDPDVVAIADGGGRALAFRDPVEGGENVARLLVWLAGRIPAGLRIQESTVNGRPGLIAQLDGVTNSVYAFEVAGDRVTRLWIIRNPEKLTLWAG